MIGEFMLAHENQCAKRFEEHAVHFVSNEIWGNGLENLTWRRKPTPPCKLLGSARRIGGTRIWNSEQGLYPYHVARRQADSARNHRLYIFGKVRSIRQTGAGAVVKSF